MGQKSIQSIVLTNFQRHKHFAATIKGNSFFLLGTNGTGKSSILRAIDHLIAQTPMPPSPVTDGEDEGELELMLAASGETYRVRRKFTKSKNGRYELHRDVGNGRFDAVLPAAERFQEIFGNVLDLSPLIDMSGKEQMELIQQVIPKDSGVLEVINKVTFDVKKLKDERLWCGRNKKDAEAKMQVPEFRELVNYVDEKPKEIDEIKKRLIDVSELQQKLTDAARINTAADGHIQTITGVLNALKDEAIKADLQSAIKKLTSKKVDVTEVEKQISTASEINDAIEVEIEEARKYNEKVAKSVEYKHTKQLITDLEKEYKGYSEQIAEKLGSISASLSKLGFGDIYEGLSLEYEMDEEGKVIKEGLFLRGIPFNRRNQSYGEMIKVLISMNKSLNPDGFNYIKIGDWNLLDEENEAAILKIAQDNDIQLGIEKVDSKKTVEIQLIEK